MSVNGRKRRARQQGVAPRHDVSPNLLLMGSVEVDLTFHQFARLLGLDLIEPCPGCQEVVQHPTKVWHLAYEISVNDTMEIIHASLH